jgi:hypothetical protein
MFVPWPGRTEFDKIQLKLLKQNMGYIGLTQTKIMPDNLQYRLPTPNWIKLTSAVSMTINADGQTWETFPLRATVCASGRKLIKSGFRTSQESRFWRVLTMVYNSQVYWVFWTFPSSGIPETRKHDVSETGSVSVLRWEGEKTQLISITGPVTEISSF